MLKKVLYFFLTIGTYASAQNFEWAKVYPTNITTNPTYLQSCVTIDGAGNPVSGHLVNSREVYGTVYYGDYAIVKRIPSGTVLRSDTLFGKANLLQLCHDKFGNLLGAGTFRQTIYFNQVTPITTGMVNDEGFIFKMDPNGNVLWLKPVTQLSPDIVYQPKITVDNDGNFWISSSDNQLNSTLRKFSNEGTLLRTIVQTNVRYVSNSAMDASGNLWVTGSTFNGSVSFNGYSSAAPFTYTEYVVKYSPSGVCQWVQYVEDVTLQEFQIVCDNAGGAYLSGNLFDSTWFGNIKAFGPRWIYDFFVTRMDADGNFLWLREVPFDNTLGDASVGSGNFLACSPMDEVFVSGFVRHTVNFGGGIVVTSFGSLDALMLKYTPSGNLVWAKHAGGISDEVGSSIASDNTGNVYLTGRLLSNSAFDTLTVNVSALSTFISKLAGAFVPVELVSFTASRENDKVLLNWTTASEQNNKGFEIERFVTGYPEWMNVGFVEGKGTTSEMSYYSFEDDYSAPGIMRYRLKQIDLDGSYEYSREIEVSDGLPSAFELMQNYPNPFNPSTRIRYRVPDNAGAVSLKIYDVLGNEAALLFNEEKPSGVYEYEFTASGKFASGIYYYRLSGNGFSDVKKMMILK